MLVAQTGRCNCQVFKREKREKGQCETAFIQWYLVTPGALSRGDSHGQAACGRAISAQRRHCPRGGAAKGRGTARSSWCEAMVTDTAFASSLRLRSTGFSSSHTQCSSPHLLVTCLLQPMCDQHPLQPTPFCSSRALVRFSQSPASLPFLHYTSC